MFINDIKLFTANERELYPALKEAKLFLKDLNISRDRQQQMYCYDRDERRNAPQPGAST